jgi:hypothetical protein
MAKKTINLGNPNGKDGDIIRDAFNKVNQNFDELYILAGQGTAAELEEIAQDYASEMFVNGTHEGVSVDYNDNNNTMNLAVTTIDGGTAASEF